jgi:CHAT domain/SIR2-like domain
MNCAELEINLHGWGGDEFSVELRFNHPGSDDEDRTEGSQLVRFDAEQLRGLLLDPAGYGRCLAAALFADPAVGRAFAVYRGKADATNVPLRVRLFIGSGGRALHELHWETLCDPQDGTPLTTRDRVYFSRYFMSPVWEPVRPRPDGPLRTLVVIANPANLARFAPDGKPLAAVDVAGELTRAEAALGKAGITALASGGKATLDHMIEELRTGYDVLYLVCHGALRAGEPRLWLENELGEAAVTAGSDLALRLRDLSPRPRLIVLASCQSAGTGAGGGAAWAALGPRLAEAGVPAVLAMQGDVSMETVAALMPRFFAALMEDGQIDRALAVARGHVRDRPDAWMPVLFLRLRSGRLWYTPGLEPTPGEFDRWPALLNNIAQGQCTPILGLGLVEGVLGSSRDIARCWAEMHHFPMAPSERDDLPQVAEYLAINQDFAFPRGELINYLRRELRRRYAGVAAGPGDDPPIDAMLTGVGRQRRQADPHEAHRVLAQLPCPIYVTANPDTLLEDALAEAGKQPESELFDWQGEGDAPASVFVREPAYRPSAARPLVYHLFGRFSDPSSLVLTEDDYFDYLMGVTGNKEAIPPVVRRALTDSALLFLGFRMDDWNFRVLFRSIVRQQGSGRRKRYAHVAVQIDPEEGQIQEPELARRYLERYFGADFSLFWGSSDQFLQELQQRRAQP